MGYMCRYPFFKLTYVYYGHARLRQTGAEWELGAGDAVFTDPHVVHTIDIGSDSCVATFIVRPETLKMSAGVFSGETGVFAAQFLRYFHGIGKGGLVYIPRYEALAGQVRERIDSIARNLWESHCEWSLFASAEIVRDLKIYNALDYLKRTDLTFERIAELVGFSLAGYLSKVFRTEFGMTLRDFRARFGSEY